MYKKIIILTFLIATLTLAGCSNNVEQTTNSNPQNEQTESLQEDGSNFENLSNFIKTIESDYIVQQGIYKDLDTLDMASKNQLASCFGNNEGSYYEVGFLPPAPEQDFSVGMSSLNLADEAPTDYDDPTVENHPANPYFSPVGWSYKLREDEAVVLCTELPPECKYFSISAYNLLSGAEQGMDLSYDKHHSTINAGELGEYNVLFASLGEQLNLIRIKSTLASGNEHFGEKSVIVFGGDKSTNDDVVKQLISSGVPESIINVVNIPSQTLNMGLQAGGDTFTILGRVSQVEGGEEVYDEYAQKLLNESELYRITPKVEDEAQTMPLDKLIVRGTGIHESNTVGHAKEDLATIRQALIDKYTAQGYKYKELYTHITVPDGITSIYNSFNGMGDNRDTSYLSTDYFKFNSSDDILITYGVNHTKTNKSTYSNAVLYGTKMINGVASVYDGLFEGSADAYLKDGHHDNDYYYTYQFDRYGTEPYSVKVEYSKDNEKGKYYGVDDGEDLVLAFRAYVEPETSIGPNYDEIIYDRAILFYK